MRAGRPAGDDHRPACPCLAGDLPPARPVPGRVPHVARGGAGEDRGRRMNVTFTDIFCGAGGSSIGLAEAGFELRLAANHWARAIETHSANFTAAEHLCADVNNYDMRRLPRTHVLWAS